MGVALEPYNPLWYEEPIPPDNLLEFAEVAKSVRVPLATGERLTTKAEFGALLRHGGVKILQPALGRVGRYHGGQENRPPWPKSSTPKWPQHLYAGPVEWAANVHFATSIPNLLIAETIETGGAFHLKLIKNTIKWEGGYILAAGRPRSGHRIRRRRRPRPSLHTGTGLHLQMQEAPCDYSKGNRFEGARPARSSAHPDGSGGFPPPHPRRMFFAEKTGEEEDRGKGKSGDPGRTRTPDPPLRRRLLYPAELRDRCPPFAQPGRVTQDQVSGRQSWGLRHSPRRGGRAQNPPWHKAHAPR